jgi:protein-S-isoprenylcysteine O-methyltransferase Ste14
MGAVMEAQPERGSKDGAAVRFPPPFVYLIALAVGVALHALVWPLRLPLVGIARAGLAAVLVGFGIALMGSALRLFRRSGQDPAPWESTPEIIATGIYRLTRNPMYLGMGLLQAGIGVALANAWVVAFVPLSWIAVYLLAIRHEEAYLDRKFGSAYAEYRKAVRRWL